MTTYQSLRSRGVRAIDALRCSRSTVPSLRWTDSRTAWKEARDERDGFSVVISAKYEEHPGEFDLHGRFVDKYSEGSVRHPEAHKNKRVLGWFLPECTYREHYRSLVKSKQHSRHECHRLARSYVLADLTRALTCGDEWSPVWVEAKVYRKGVLLGSHSVGGFSTEGTDEDLSAEAHDIVNEALHEAKETLRRLSLCL